MSAMDRATRPQGTAILVVGSINMDLVARCPHIPVPGETIIGSDFTLTSGGKGANGATAAARLIMGEAGGVAMLGAVGRDDNGAALRRNLQERGVAVTYVQELDGVPSGVALIAVADDGENNIIVVPGANSRVDPAAVTAALPAVSPRLVLMQLEIPLDTVVHAAAQARRSGIRVLLDPAPAPAMLPATLFASVDILLPNEGELATLSGLPAGSDEETARAAVALRERGVGMVVVKRGERGALVVDDAGVRAIPSLRVDVVDTTGAGDCFDGAFAVALAEGQAPDAAARFATHAAALSCTRLGAQSAQPTRADVERALRG